MSREKSKVNCDPLRPFVKQYFTKQILGVQCSVNAFN